VNTEKMIKAKNTYDEWSKKATLLALQAGASNGVAIAIPSAGLEKTDNEDLALFRATRDIKQSESVTFPAELLGLRFTVEKPTRK
jgi:hypothetical protein